MHRLQMILHAALFGEHPETDGTSGLPAVQRSVVSERGRREKLPIAYLTPLARVPGSVWKWKNELKVE